MAEPDDSLAGSDVPGHRESDQTLRGRLARGEKTLATLIRNGPVGPRRAAAIVAGIAEAIERAHGRGGLHRDLNPTVVRLDEDDEPHLTDRDLVRVFEESDPGQPLASANQAPGEPHYMSPERADPRRGPMTPRTDVYGLGGLLFALLTGEPPIDGDSPKHVLARLLSDEPARSPSELRPDVPPALDRICRRCLSKEPADRYASARDVADALRSWLARPDASEVDPNVPRAGRGARRTGRPPNRAQRPAREASSWSISPTWAGEDSDVRLRRIVAAGAILAASVLFLALTWYQARSRAPREGAAGPPVPIDAPARPDTSPATSPSPGPPVQITVEVAPEVVDRLKADPGSLAIVLDWSVSSGRPSKQAPRLLQAREALARVLAAGVPEGTAVSVWMSGQAPRSAASGRDEPVVRQPETSIARIYPPTRWKASEARRLLAALDRHDPHLETSLAEAMRRAAHEDLVGKAGPRKLLVLTDGAEARTRQAAGQDIGPFLQSTFRDLRVQVWVVSVDSGDDPSDRERVRKDLQRPLARLDPPGHFVAPGDLSALIADLRNAVAAGPTCALFHQDGTPVDDGVVPWTRTGETARPCSVSLEPGIYRVRAIGYPRIVAEKEVRLRPGASLRIRLLPATDGGVEIRTEPQAEAAEAR